MLNFLYVIFMNFFRAPFMISKMRYHADHPEKYTEEERYRLAQQAVHYMNHSGKITTIAVGTENLPEEGGYIMFPNHQGKYDVNGIVFTHEKPCSFVMDKNKSYTILVREFIDLLQGKRLEIDNPRQGIVIINAVAKAVSEGKRYILFPEGGYKFNNRNIIEEFKAGSFKIALKSHVPIIPVCLVDSYKVFNSWHVGPTTTYVYYLEPIYYEEYKDMKTQELAEYVKARIQAKMDEHLATHQSA